MSDQVTVGDYSLEISGDEVLVRDENGAVVEEVKLDDVQGELTLPDGKKVDLASLFADSGIDALQTAAGAAGPANDNLGSINGGSGVFHAFHGNETEFGGLRSAGTLGDTSLDFNALNSNDEPDYSPKIQEEAPVLVTWSGHDPWHIAENESGGSFGKVVNGNPADFKYEVSDPRFEVVDGVLRVRDGVSFDFESEPGIDLEITVTSRTGDVKTLSTHIDITDVNEAQTGLSLDHAAVNENVPGAIVGTLTVADPDGDDSQNFQVSDNRFEVVDGQLKLKDGVSLDHESDPTLDVTVTVTDNGGNQITKTFTIAVGDVNEAQTALTLDSNNVAENQAGAIVGTLTVADPDAGDSQSFSVSDNRFEIVGGQLKLKDGVSLDHEGEPNVNVTVTATDSAGHQIQQTFAITVGDVNEAQTALSLDNASVAENTAGAIIGALTVADPDAGDSQSFAVSDNRFEIVDGQLKLKDGVSLDHEGEPNVNVTVTATDSAGHQIQQTFAIAVGDANEAQTALSLDNASVAENAAGAVIGTLTVADPDAGDSQSFQVSDNRFEVIDGQLKLKDGVALNHEGEPTVNVTVTATDNGGHQIQQNFAITVGDVNEAPVDINLSGNNLVENVAGAVIGTLTAIDPDADDSHSFDVSDNRFEVVNGQLKLKDGVSIDFETESSLNVVVTATDSAGNTVQETFTLSVGGTNEAQTALSLDQVPLMENSYGAIVGTLTVADPDAGDSQSFFVSDNRFEVVDGQLKLKDGVALNHESEPTVNVQVTATDSAGHQIAQSFAINVGDVNEAQTALSLSASKVTENVAGAVIGALSVVDPDAGDSQSFQVSDNRFEVVNGQLKLKDGVSLDHEGEPTVNVQVTATDAGGNQIAKTFAITVGDVNEAQTSLTLSNSSVAENAKGAIIGNVLVVDPDAGDKQTYSVSDSRFQIVNGQLKLKSGVSIDYESESHVDVKVTATDKSGHQISQTFTINVNDVNEKQTDMTLSASKVSENSAGAVIGTLSVADPDAGDSQSFKVSDNRFEVVNGQLKLKDGVSLNYEAGANINVKVTATDAANHTITKTFTIGVQDVNEAQTAMTLSATKVSENAAGAVIGSLKVTDPDAGDSQSLKVSDNRFEVVNGQLKLKDGVSLDYEQGSKVGVDVTATDSAGHTITKTFSIGVTNVNEAQTDMTLSANSVKENAAGVAIGKLTVTDPDAGDKQSFTVSDARFEVVNNQLRLKPGVSLDFEQASSLSVDVTATDKGGNQITKTFTINVTDVNEAQTALTLDNKQVAENTPGGVIGKLTVADQDIGDTQSFKVSDNRFEIVNGQLKLKPGVSFDHETTGSVDVTVTATDSAKHSISQTFTISIGDVNEAQTGMAVSNGQVQENVAGAVISTVSVTDPDVGDSQTFQVSDNRFEVVNGQLQLKSGVSLDYESASSIDVTVTATDAGGHQISKTVTVTVGDVNEAQTSLSLSNASVAENAAGAVIGTLTVADPDAGDKQSFSVSDNRFEVVNNQLQLKSGISLDHEGEPTVNVTVTPTDSGGHQIQQTFAINVGDVNEAQTGMSLSNASVAENAAGAVIGTLTVADPDDGDTQSFQVSDNRFEVVNNQLQLKSGVSLDHEGEPTVNVTVTATDAGGHQIQQAFAINVADVNEAQTGMSLSASKVAENSTGAVIGTLSVSDPDAGDSQSFQVSDSRFEVVNNQLKLKSGVSLDFEQASSINVTVTATDSANHQYAQTFAVTVTDVNEAPTAIQLSNLSVNENAAGATVGALTTSDPDAGDTFNYQVSDNRFQVVNGQLQLKSGISLDHETEPTVNLKVTSTDSAGHSIQQSFTVNIANVNEAPTATAKDGSYDSHIINTSSSYNPSASSTVGGYLYSNDSANVAKPAANLLNGVDPANMGVSATTPVSVTFQKEAAGNHNMVGTYQYDSSGNIIPGSVKFVWLDASAGTEGQLGAAMVKDFLGYNQANTVSLGTLPYGTHVGFFTISNGASDSGNKTLLTGAATGTNSQAAAMDAIASQLSIKIDANGNGHVYVGNSQMNGDVFFTHNKTLNTDFNGSSDIDHFASGVNANLAHQLVIGVEDLNGGGDRDYNDVVFSVNLGNGTFNMTTHTAVQPQVDFSDIDSSTLSQAVIHTTGFQAGDTLNVPASALFSVTVDHSTADYTITIVGKTGNETVDQYEQFANSISFSSSSQTEGDRHIDYTVTDSGGLTSTPATADIGVGTGYEVSSSQLSNGQNTLGSGDDLLHLNASSHGPTNMGDGYDTVHLASQGMSFGHNDAVKLSNVEAVDTTGYGANNVSLSINDVLNMTDTDHHLTVIGEKGDTVTLTNSGNDHWAVVDQNAQFTTYAYSDPAHQAIVEISNQLNTQVS